MKTYEQWSSRMKQLGKPSDQYSQAAYQGYINNMKNPKPKPKPKPNSNGGGAVRPLPAPPPLQTNQSQELEDQITQLSEAVINLTANQASSKSSSQSSSESFSEKKPIDASQALASTLLTGVGGVAPQKKKKRKFLTPIGG